MPEKEFSKTIRYLTERIIFLGRVTEKVIYAFNQLDRFLADNTSGPLEAIFYQEKDELFEIHRENDSDQSSTSLLLAFNHEGIWILEHDLTVNTPLPELRKCNHLKLEVLQTEEQKAIVKELPNLIRYINAKLDERTSDSVKMYGEIQRINNSLRESLLKGFSMHCSLPEVQNMEFQMEQSGN